jgi:hypothetical protein
MPALRPYRKWQEPGQSSDEILRGGPGGGGGGMGERTGSSNRPVGVPDDYRAPVERQRHGNYYPSGYNYRTRTWGRNARPSGIIDSSLPEHSHVGQPRYRENDIVRPGAWDPARIFELQSQMAEAGLLTTSFIPGIFGPESQDAYAQVLGIANMRGISREAAMALIAAGGGLAEFDPETGQLVTPGTEGAGAGQGLPQPPSLITHTTDPVVLGNIFRRAVQEIASEGWGQGQINSAVLAYNALERKRQEDLYNAQIATGQFGIDPETGQTIQGAEPAPQQVVDIPTPESWVDAYVRKVDPGHVAEQQFLTSADEFMALASSPAWGVGGQV